MQKNSKHFLFSHNWYTVGLAGIICFYFISRIFFLTAQPMFGDEALYVWFARDGLTAPHNWFISLVVGRQPLFIWITALMLAVFKNPLFAVRVVSVFSGFATMVGLALFSYEIFQNKKIVLFTMLLMLFYPFAFVYDRLGILDSMVGAIYIWSLCLSFLLARKTTLLRAVSLGILLGAGLLLKSNLVFALVLLPVSFFLLPQVKKHRKRNIVLWVGSILLVIIIAQGIALISSLAPNYAVVGLVDKLFVYSLSQIVLLSPKFIAGHLVQNVRFIGNYIYSYLTIPYLLLLGVGMATANIKNKEKLIIFLYSLLPAIAIVFFGKELHPRYIYFLTLPLFIFMGEAMYTGIDGVYRRINTHFSFPIVGAFISMLILVYPGYVCWKILTDFPHAPILLEDRQEFTTNTGGYVGKAVNFFCLQLASGKKINVGIFTGEDVSLPTYLETNPSITFVSYFSDGRSVPKQLNDFAKKVPTYLVTYKTNDISSDESRKLSLVFTAPQTGSAPAFNIYKIPLSK